MPSRRTCRLHPVAPYDLAVAVRGHGWYDLPPHDWDDATAALRTAVALDDRRAVDVTVRAGPDGALSATLVAAAPPTRAQLGELERGLRRTLRVDVDLGEFWAECGRHERLRWVPSRRAGHLMQSPTLFEDLLKILFTTNCSWAATRSMCRNLVDALGPAAPSGRRAFPSAAVCAAQPETFWRDIVRAGYRAGACAWIARACATGALTERELLELGADPDALRRRLLALPGFGPYAVGHAMRGLGHFGDLALDSWCRAKTTERLGRRRPPSDAWFAREYRRFGRFAGLALWMDLTADWHGAAER